MSKIVRDPSGATKQKFDLIIIGGGIYGVMLTLESSRRGLSCLLLEKGDFGEQTSFNSLRIIHGGFRYLQNLDFHRFRESVNERRWFLLNFPELVKPLPCLMPLYGNGLRRPSVLRAALLVSSFFSHKRNVGVRPDRILPAGGVIGKNETKKIFTAVDMDNLKGAAVWYDAFVPDSQRLVIDLLRWSCQLNATALNYVEAKRLITTGNKTIGIQAIDHESSNTFEFRSKVVINAAGPFSRILATKFDKDIKSLFYSSIGWNLLFDRKALSNHALAVTPKIRSARTYFLCPWKGKLLAGTGHASWRGSLNRPAPSEVQISEFINELNFTVPDLNVRPDEIICVFAGFLPAITEGGDTPANREVIVDHSNHNGPKGLYSISGVKFTTARCVAEKTLKSVFPDKRFTQDLSSSLPRSLMKSRGLFEIDLFHSNLDSASMNTIRRIIKEEAVLYSDDLIFRRTNLWEKPSAALTLASHFKRLFSWDASRCEQEKKRLREKFVNQGFSLDDHKKTRVGNKITAPVNRGKNVFCIK